MRTLKFIVDGLTLKQDPKCNFDGLVPNTEGYLQAEFSFSSEWNGCVKVAAFWSVMGKEYPPQKLENGKTCIIPAEALKGQAFEISVLGKNAHTKLVTNNIKITQNGG